MAELTHIDSNGRISMVDVSDKKTTQREATAYGEIKMRRDVIDKIRASSISKGNVLETAKIAGIMAAKRCGEMIPLCHSLTLSLVKIDFTIEDERVLLQCTVKSTGKTGVEMEALSAATVAALTVYDMCKALDKEMVLGPFYLLKKSGGRSGTFVRSEVRDTP